METLLQITTPCQLLYHRNTVTCLETYSCVSDQAVRGGMAQLQLSERERERDDAEMQAPSVS